MTYTTPPYFYVYVMQGDAADRPPATGSGSPPQDSLYWATDTSVLSITDGSAWSDIGGAGGSPVTSVFARIGAVIAANADYYGIVAAATAGNTAASRYVGATASGHPTTGAHLLGDFVVDQTGAFWVCTVAGTPGTWVSIGGGGIAAWGQTSTAKYAGSSSPVGVVTPDAEGDLYIDDTTPALWQATGVADTDWQLVGGSSGSWPTQTGSGSPVGTVAAAAVGDTYADTTNGAVWIAGATGSADWFSVGGFAESSFGLPGVQLDADINTIWGIIDTVFGGPGLSVQTAAAAGTTSPPVNTSNNTLDDGNTGAATFSGQVDAASLGPTIPYVTLQAGAPAGPYQTPLVFDTTAVTGGAYGWDGAAYQKIGGPL